MNPIVVVIRLEKLELIEELAKQIDAETDAEKKRRIREMGLGREDSIN